MVKGQLCFMSVVSRELPTSLSHLYVPITAGKLALHFERTRKLSTKQREQTPQDRIRDQNGTFCPASFSNGGEMQYHCLYLPGGNWDWGVRMFFTLVRGWIINTNYLCLTSLRNVCLVVAKQILRGFFGEVPPPPPLYLVNLLCAKPCSGAWVRLVRDGVKTRLSVQSLALSYSLAARTGSETRDTGP